MKLLKKISIAIIATLATTTMLTACSKEQGSFEEYKAANINMANIESLTMVGNISVGTQLDAESEVEVIENMILSSTSMNKGESMIMETSSAMNPSIPVQEVFISDGFSYVSLGDDLYLKSISTESTGMNAGKIQEISKIMNEDIINMLKDIEMATTAYSPLEGEDASIKGIEYSFDVPKEIYKEIFGVVATEMFDNDEYREAYFEQTKAQLLSFGMPQEELEKEETIAEIKATIETTIEMYKSILATLEFDQLSVKQVIDGDIVVKSEFDVKVSQDNLLAIMGDATESLSAILPMMFGENESLSINSAITYTDINAVTEIDMPTFTDENSFTQEEYMAKVMEEFAGAGGIEIPSEGGTPPLDGEVAPAPAA